jgi:hypothetical protein
MLRELYIIPRLTDDQVKKLRGELLSDKDYNRLITYDADVYCEETGKCIAKFRKKIIPSNIAQTAFENLKTAAKPTYNRGGSLGEKDEKGNSTRLPIKKDGTRSYTNSSSVSANSGIIGYFDPTPRFPYCRQTSFNLNEFSKFKKAYPIIKLVDSKYAELMPEHYAKQRKQADETSQDFVIHNTAFTTVTVNKNWQTAVHTDKGDFADGFGNLVVLRKGRYTGGYFVLPKWGVAFDMQNCDLLLTDVHQWHGNTPIVKIDDNATRISLVMYYREQMIHCGSAEEEVSKGKYRQKGDKLS